jgi:type III secretion protein W
LPPFALRAMHRIDAHSFAPALSPLPDDHAHHDRKQRGTVHGTPVLIKTEAQSLLTSAEERSVAMAAKIEAKAVEARTFSHDSSLQQLMQIRQITAYLDTAQRGQDAEALIQLAQRMRDAPEQARSLARRAFPDATTQFLALQYAIRSGQEDGVPDASLEALFDALAELEADHGGAIRADLNTVEAAAEQAHSAADVLHFQSTYKDVVLGESSLANTLRLLLRRFGLEGFDAGRRQLIAALGLDVSAQRPSGDLARLNNLVQDLYHLQVIGSMQEDCRKLASYFARRFNIATLSPMQLMEDLIALSGERWAAAGRFVDLASRFGILLVAAQIAFYTRTRGLLGRMPTKIFADLDCRLAIIGAAQEALDLAIEQEQAEEDRRQEEQDEQEDLQQEAQAEQERQQATEATVADDQPAPSQDAPLAVGSR